MEIVFVREQESCKKEHSRDTQNMNQNRKQIIQEENP